MKHFSLRRNGFLAVPCIGAALSLGTHFAAAQTTHAAAQGKVLFSRSTDANGQTTTYASPAAGPAAPQPAPAPAADPALEAARQAVTFTSYDLDVHLRPADQQIDVRARLTVRNDGKTALARIPLQISSSLHWDEIRVDGHAGQSQTVAFQTATLNSDADHTGQLQEAEVPLSIPLQPGQSLRLDVTYSGKIAASAARLEAIGAPDAAALRTDWDQIGVDFTGLRGLGNVVWYPVATVPVLLGDGARLFDELGAQKLRLTGAHFRLNLVDEFPHGQAPTVAVIDGHSVPLHISESGTLDLSQQVDGVATASLDSATLGFEAPSLFVAIRTPHPNTNGDANLAAWTLPDNNVNVEFWTIAAGSVTPFLQSWLGKRPRSPLTLLDLPDPKDAPFASGALLAAPLGAADAQTDAHGLQVALVHALAQAWLTPPAPEQPPPAWLNDGVATFMTTLWVEKQQGRDAALRLLDADRDALALAEPDSPGDSAGQPLAQAISPVYYRTKAAYVLWMLRDLVGDSALATALRGAPDPNAADSASTSPLTTASFEKQLESGAGAPNLRWFFADWIDADKGLPDLSITGVYPNPVEAGNWLVAVDLNNTGYAAAEIPVTIHSKTSVGLTSITKRVRVPARQKITERILVLGNPVSVEANDGTVPEIEASVHITHLDSPTPASANLTNPPQF